ncbi:hypothetical protein [Streptomyces sp. ISL-100]|uniref:hypothetical protein n=1 Tax=Streptomyces sp. ISL-100 TaxID=2819173 RepID=UPI001BE5228B|nr:hypothetical protein [Streptomyces sp. ISL-100]MBT2395273.1 hypothetical protein [Streptomyces sp. ISL-100]
MTSSLPPIKIHVLGPDAHDDDVPLTDVGVVNLDGERHLFLSPQSFNSAVRQVSSAMPDLPIEQVERLVRDHCDFRDFDELLAPPAEPAPPVDLPPPPHEPTAAPARAGGGRAKKWAIAAALLPAFVGTWALGHATGEDQAPTAASTPDVSPDAANAPVGDKNLGPEPFTARDFMDFSDAGRIDCNPIDNLEAECTDSDGMVMATKAATGPDSTIFTFSYGAERLGLRIFGDGEYAETWSKQDGSRELYPNMVRSGRYVLWGTDKGRLNEYLDLLKQGLVKKATQAQANTVSFAEPLPPRLAALTLGTLGLDESDVNTILFSPQDAPVDAPVLMAAQAVLGVGGGSAPTGDPGAEDIVALAAGLELPPAESNEGESSAHTGDGAGSVVVVTDPAPAASTGGTSTTPPATDPSPTPDPKPSGDGQTQEPVDPPEPETPATPDPKPEEPKPTEPETPPVLPGPPPVDPAPPVTTPVPPIVTDPPAPPQEPDPAEPQPPAQDDGTGEPPTTGEQKPSGDVGDGQLALPYAWIAPAA